MKRKSLKQLDQLAEQIRNEGRVSYCNCERCRLLERIEELEGFARNVRDGYDCDEDGHKYRTGCRCCEADGLLGGRGFVPELCNVPYVSLDDQKRESTWCNICFDFVCTCQATQQKRNDAMERGDYERDRAKDEKHGNT